MHVLGLTDMRANEMRRPFEAMDRRGTLVVVDPSHGVRAYASALRRGSRHVARRESDAILVYNGSGLIGAVGAVLSAYHDIPLLIRQNGDVLRQHREQFIEYVRRREWVSLLRYVRFALLTRITYGYAHGFVPVSETLTNIVHRQTGCPIDRIRHVPNPLRTDEYFAPVIGSGRGRADGQRILTVTNLDFRGKYEGVVELVVGLLPVLRRRSDVEYTIAGDGQYYDRLKRTLDDVVDDEDVRNRIHAPGFVDDIVDCYADTDVFVYNSYIDGYPNVILEAQAAGLPVVTAPSYGVTEQVHDGESGVFADPSEGDEFSRTVESLLDDPDERARLGRNARRRVRIDNAPEVVGRRLYDAVESIVDSREDRGSTGDAVQSDAGPAERVEDRPSDAG